MGLRLLFGYEHFTAVAVKVHAGGCGSAVNGLSTEVVPLLYGYLTGGGFYCTYGCGGAFLVYEVHCDAVRY